MLRAFCMFRHRMERLNKIGIVHDKSHRQLRHYQTIFRVKQEN